MEIFSGGSVMDKSSVDPILMDIPESFESERLIIRAPIWGDGAPLNEAVRESYDELKPWMLWLSSMPTIEESEIHLRKARLDFLERKELRLLLIDKQTGKLIGSSGLHALDWQARKFEIGYWIRTSCTRQGYVTEAVHAITKFAIEKLDANRIEIRCDLRNEQSASVAKRCGFIQEGILRSNVCDVEGAITSTMIFSKVRGAEF